ncbi:hypothetical protein EOD39_7527 [Acipenser ruthenus]|uniref:Uncharacterized protein n=1 Tax=Acipenser ruthenus TaxID=7906 RepID=A0A662YZD5_ACIRT|nr:hypothetical protein EOD39_7527 [Acipenser ruthenus]
MLMEYQKETISWILNFFTPIVKILKWMNLCSSPRWFTDGAGQQSKTKRAEFCQGGQALEGEDRPRRIFHGEQSGNRAPRRPVLTVCKRRVREATESLDLPPGGDRYLDRGFEGTVTEPEPPGPHGRRDREDRERLQAAAISTPAGGAERFGTASSSCGSKTTAEPAAQVPSKGTRRVKGRYCETVGARE